MIAADAEASFGLKSSETILANAGSSASALIVRSTSAFVAPRERGVVRPRSPPLVDRLCDDRRRPVGRLHSEVVALFDSLEDDEGSNQFLASQDVGAGVDQLRRFLADVERAFELLVDRVEGILFGNALGERIHLSSSDSMAAIPPAKTAVRTRKTTMIVFDRETIVSLSRAVASIRAPISIIVSFYLRW